MNLHPIYALATTSLMVPAVALTLMAGRALAAEPQMPENFHGTWCGEGEFPGESSYYSGQCPKHEPDPDRCYDRSSNPGYTYYRAECVIKPRPRPLLRNGNHRHEGEQPGGLLRSSPSH
jgi:hypothetical protein